MRRTLALVAAFLIVPLPARGDALDPTAATELFKQGREALARDDLATACAKFAESQRLDPKVGTLLNLAQCEESRKHLAAARAVWLQAVELAHATSDPRETVARERIVTIDKRIPKLRVDLEEAPPGAKVSCDEQPFTVGTSTAVDPGRHVITITAAGRKSATTTLTLAEGEERTVIMRAGFELAPPVSRAEPPPSPRTRISTIATWSLVGVSGGAFVVSAWFGTQALRRNKDSERYCDANNACAPTGVELRADARRDASWSTVAFVVGGACLASAIVIWAVTPRDRPAVSVSVAPFSMQLEATW